MQTIDPGTFALAYALFIEMEEQTGGSKSIALSSVKRQFGADVARAVAQQV